MTATIHHESPVAAKSAAITMLAAAGYHDGRQTARVERLTYVLLNLEGFRGRVEVVTTPDERTGERARTKFLRDGAWAATKIGRVTYRYQVWAVVYGEAG